MSGKETRLTARSLQHRRGQKGKMNRAAEMGGAGHNEQQLECGERYLSYRLQSLRTSVSAWAVWTRRVYEFLRIGNEEKSERS